MKQGLKIALASFVIAAAAIKAGPALAEPTTGNDLNVSVVRTADLDLGSSDGRRELDRRLANAARDVCGTASDVDLEGKNAVRQCRHDVLARTNADRGQLLAAAARGAMIAVTNGH